jgi:hypothetical protein
MLSTVLTGEASGAALPSNKSSLAVPSAMLHLNHTCTYSCMSLH